MAARTPTKRQGPSDQARLKGGMTTLGKLGVSHYQLMGKRSAEVRRLRKELQDILKQVQPQYRPRHQETDESS